MLQLALWYTFSKVCYSILIWEGDILENPHLVEREKQAHFLFCQRGLMSSYAENINKSSVLSFQFLMFCVPEVLVLQYKKSAWGP